MAIFDGVRKGDVVLAAALTALGVISWSGTSLAGATGSAIDSHSWLMVPVFAAATLPVLWRRTELRAVLVRDRGRARRPRPGFRLGRPLRRRAAAGLRARLRRRPPDDRPGSHARACCRGGIQFLVLVTDSAAGLDIIPFTA